MMSYYGTIPPGGGAGLAEETTPSTFIPATATPDYHSQVLIAYHRMGEGRARFMHKGIFVVVTILEYYWWQNRQALSLPLTMRSPPNGTRKVRIMYYSTRDEYAIAIEGSLPGLGSLRQSASCSTIHMQRPRHL
jgi:hypothetical protein